MPRRRSNRSSARSRRVRQGHVRAVVTNPIAKATLYQAGFKYPGHTEYLGALAEAWGAPAFPVMMIWSETLAVVPVTIHIPLADVARALTAELIIKTGRVVDRDMRARFRRDAAASGGRRPQSPRGRGRSDGARGDHDHRTRDRDAAGRRNRHRRAAPRRYDVPPQGAGALRCGAHNVSRPGPDPGRRPSPSTKASMSRSACRSCAHPPIMARRSTSPERGSRIRRASSRRSSSPTD